MTALELALDQTHEVIQEKFKQSNINLIKLMLTNKPINIQYSSTSQKQITSVTRCLENLSRHKTLKTDLELSQTHQREVEAVADELFPSSSKGFDSQSKVLADQLEGLVVPPSLVLAGAAA